MPTGGRNDATHDHHQSRMLQIRAILSDRNRRRASGEVTSDDELMHLHSGLMPELGQELRKLQIINAAQNKAQQADYSGQAETVQHDKTPKGSRGLQICCPHCSNLVEVVTDTPYEEICCSTCGSSFSLVDRSEMTRMAAPLKSIGRFDLISRIGVGGFGTVWKARDVQLDRTVAVKIPRRGQLAASEIDQFFREARAAAQLRHANIVPVYEVGRDGETLFIVSDLIRGVTLTDWLSAGRRTVREIVELSVAVADALQHAHLQGIVHRDLKPSNIMIDEEGRPHLTDFGLAKREAGEITMTVDGQILGTPAYMSPEQAAGRAHWTDRRTDIYSFGVVLFELLTGELPFRGNAQMQVHQRLTENAPDPRKLNHHIPRDLATICCKCLEREPGRRYQTSLELLEDLRHFQRGEPISARPITRLERAIRWATQRPMKAALIGLVVFDAAVGPLVAWKFYRDREQLQQKDVANANLINKRLEERDQARRDVMALTDEVKRLKGETSSWVLWPPNPGEPPRFLEMNSLLDARRTTLETAAPNETAEQHARRMIALGIAAETVKRSEEAQQYFTSAVDILTQLVAEQPDNISYELALADCYESLSRLTAADVAKSNACLLKAVEVYRALAASHPSDAQYQALRLNAEMRSNANANFHNVREQLDAAGQLNTRLGTLWPKSGDELYRLACVITGHPAWLFSTEAAPPKPTATGP